MADKTREKARFNLEAGFALLARRYPFLASALFRMTPIYKPEVPTAAVDRFWRLYYGEWFASLTPRQAEAVLYHELLHLIQDHFRREQLFRSPASDLFINIVQDMEINDDVEEEGFELPRIGDQQPWHPRLLGLPTGLTWEEYHDRILDQAEEIERSVGDRVQDHLHGSATGRPCPFEEPGEGEPSGVTEAEAEVIRQGLAEAIAKYPGSVPGHLARWAQERLRPKVPWQKVLRSLVRSGLGVASGAVDYRYGKPHRRQATSAVILPRLIRPQARILVCIDTSGSVEDRILSQFLAEVGGVAKVAGVPVDVASGDTELATFQRGIVDPAKVRVEGGGGTDMGQLLAQAWSRSQAQVVVVLTDGWTPWPKANPTRAKVIVATTDRPGPDWAQTVTIRDA